MLMLMIPILRVADNLDRSHEQRIRFVECRAREAEVVVEVRTRGDIDLEEWGAERAGEAFRQVYNRPIRVVRQRD
jgi:exopolyphosphatase/guanosine-5'-triphosphate,3'-diphosphate pyrophosphatase